MWAERLAKPNPTSEADTTSSTSPAGLGWFPVLAATSATGVLLVVVADARSRSTLSSSQTLFWLGLLVVYVPIVLRLCSSRAGRNERLALTVLLGISLYVVKISRDPFGFTFGDELAHAPNANAILSTHELFTHNPILAVSASYPGLESLCAALASMSGLSSFGAGLIVIGAARLLILLALYLLFERLSGSPRVAALGVAIYTANPNFLLWSAQFSYESLALPLAVSVIFAVTELRSAEDRMSWSIVIVLVTFAVVVTHHLSSYALDAALLAICLVSLAVRDRRVVTIGVKSDIAPPWPFALFALLATAAWLTYVASATVGYLTFVLYHAFAATLHTVSGGAARRHLFVSDSGQSAPILERLVGVGSVLLMAAGLPFGLRTLWRRHREDPLAIVLAVAAAGFFGTVVLRFVPAAWETANRSSEYLFLGVGFVLALVGLDRWSPRRAPWLGPGLTAASLAVVFAGGVIAGWPADLLLAQPYRIKAGSHVLDSEARQVARWADVRLGPGRRFAASEADARLLATYAGGFAVSGGYPDIRDILESTTLPAWQLALLYDNRLRYVVLDRRDRSSDVLTGYFFGRRPGGGVTDALFPVGITQKFDGIRADRVYDSGDIVVYDLGPGR